MELVYPFARDTDLTHWEVILIVVRVSKELYGRSSDILWFLNEHWNEPYGYDICNQTATGGISNSSPFLL